MPDAVGTFILIILFALYCIPLFVAMLRNHHQILAILVLNLCFGWTLLGWAVALIWSFTNPAPVVRTTAGD